MNQLISIAYEVFKSFDEGYQVRRVFLDRFQAFDKVWHEDLLFKLKQNDISGNLLSVYTDFLKDGKQRVVLRSTFYMDKH